MLLIHANSKAGGGGGYSMTLFRLLQLTMIIIFKLIFIDSYRKSILKWLVILKTNIPQYSFVIQLGYIVSKMVTSICRRGSVTDTQKLHDLMTQCIVWLIKKKLGYNTTHMRRLLLPTIR